MNFCNHSGTSSSSSELKYTSRTTMVKMTDRALIIKIIVRYVAEIIEKVDL